MGKPRFLGKFILIFGFLETPVDSPFWKYLEFSSPIEDVIEASSSELLASITGSPESNHSFELSLCFGWNKIGCCDYGLHRKRKNCFFVFIFVFHEKWFFKKSSLFVKNQKTIKQPIVVTIPYVFDEFSEVCSIFGTPLWKFIIYWISY